MTSTSISHAGTERILPKRFALLPSSDGSLKVNLAAKCVGYVCPDAEKWSAKDSKGAVLDGDLNSIFEAVTAIFNAHSNKTVLS